MRNNMYAVQRSALALSLALRRQLDIIIIIILSCRRIIGGIIGGIIGSS